MTPLHRTDPVMKCWRIAAIYRACLRHGLSRERARHEIRVLYPDGSRDGTVDLWWVDMEHLRRRHHLHQAAETAIDICPERPVTHHESDIPRPAAPARPAVTARAIAV